MCRTTASLLSNPCVETGLAPSILFAAGDAASRVSTGKYLARQRLIDRLLLVGRQLSHHPFLQIA
jgi:hypothetical protein